MCEPPDGPLGRAVVGEQGKWLKAYDRGCPNDLARYIWLIYPLANYLLSGFSVIVLDSIYILIVKIYKKSSSIRPSIALT